MFSSKNVDLLNSKWDELKSRGIKEFKQNNIVTIAANDIFWLTYDSKKTYGIRIVTNEKINTQELISKEFKRLKIVSSNTEIRVSLENNIFNEHFRNLINFILNKIDLAGEKDKKSIKTFFNELDNAKDLLSGENLPSKLTPEKEIGLYGELYFLVKILNKKINIKNCILSWTGPNKKHDFTFLNLLVEIKTTISKDNYKVKTSSSDQLSPVFEKQLYLTFLKFKKNTTGESLIDLIENIQKEIKNNEHIANEFYLKLLKIGYFNEHSDYYLQKYSLLEEKFYLIDEKFPFINRALIKVPESIEKLEFTYEIDLKKCSQSEKQKTDLIIKL